MPKGLKISAAGMAILLLFFAGLKFSSWIGRSAEEPITRATPDTSTSATNPATLTASGNVTAPAEPMREDPPPLVRRPRWARGTTMDVSKNPAFNGLQASAVTLDYEAAAPEQAMQAVYRAFKIPLPGNGRASTFLTAMGQTSMHLQEVPYLEALLDFSAMTNARLRTLTQDILEFSPLSTAPAGPIAARDESSVGVWCLAGPFALTLDRIDTSISLPVGIDAARTSAITFTAFAEPSIRVTAFPHDLTIEKFVDNKDQPLRLSGQQVTNGGNRTPTTLRFMLERPADCGARIAVLKGTATFVVMSESTPIKFPLPLTQRVTQTTGGITIDIVPSGGAPSATIPSVQIRFTRADMPAEKWQQFAPVLAAIPISATGGGLAASPPGVRSDTVGRSGRAAAPPPVGDSVTLIATFARGNTLYPPADQAVLDIPLTMREVPMPFEFRDLVLP